MITMYRASRSPARQQIARSPVDLKLHDILINKPPSEGRHRAVARSARDGCPVSTTDRASRTSPNPRSARRRSDSPRRHRRHLLPQSARAVMGGSDGSTARARAERKRRSHFPAPTALRPEEDVSWGAARRGGTTGPRHGQRRYTVPAKCSPQSAVRPSGRGNQRKRTMEGANKEERS